MKFPISHKLNATTLSILFIILNLYVLVKVNPSLEVIKHSDHFYNENEFSKIKIEHHKILSLKSLLWNLQGVTFMILSYNIIKIDWKNVAWPFVIVTSALVMLGFTL